MSKRRKPNRFRVYNPLMVIGMSLLSAVADLLFIGFGAQIEYRFPNLGNLVLILVVIAIGINTFYTYRFIKENYV